MKHPSTGPLFDEDDILGVITSSDPMSTAAHQITKKTAAAAGTAMMSQ